MKYLFRYNEGRVRQPLTRGEYKYLPDDEYNEVKDFIREYIYEIILKRLDRLTIEDLKECDFFDLEIIYIIDYQNYPYNIYGRTDKFYRDKYGIIPNPPSLRNSMHKAVAEVLGEEDVEGLINHKIIELIRNEKDNVEILKEYKDVLNPFVYNSLEYLIKKEKYNI